MQLARVKAARENAQRLRLLAEAARADVNFFANIVWPTVEQGRFKKQYALQMKWQNHFNSTRRAGVLAPKGHGKTTQVLIRLLWLIGNNPDILIKYVCASDELAVDRIMAVRDIIENNKLYKYVFPNIRKHPTRNDWSRFSATVNRVNQSKDSTLEALGVLSTGSGGRADLLVFDDVCDLENTVHHPQTKLKVKDAVFKVWMKQLVHGGGAIWIATPQAEGDATAAVMASPEWSFLIDKIDENNTPVCEEMWPKEALDALEREEKDSYNFSHRLILEDSKENPIKREWCQEIISIYDGRPPFRLCSWDFASGKSARSDYVSCVTVDAFPESKRIAAFRRRQWRGLTLNGIIDCIREVNSADQPTYHLLQAVSFEIFVSQGLTPEMAVPFKTWTPQLGKPERAKIYSVWFERKNVVFVNTEECLDLARRCAKYPRLDHDDDVDALLAGIQEIVTLFRGQITPEDARSTGQRSALHGAEKGDIYTEETDQNIWGGEERSLSSQLSKGRRIVW